MFRRYQRGRYVVTSKSALPLTSEIQVRLYTYLFTGFVQQFIVDYTFFNLPLAFLKQYSIGKCPR